MNAMKKRSRLAVFVTVLALIFAGCAVALTGCGKKVESITLDQTTLTLTKGETKQLEATIVPEDAKDLTVAWTSDDETVATVADDGTVTAVKSGEATITVTTTDGGYTATCEVTVVNPATGVTVSETTLSMTKGDEKTITATVAPADADDKTVTWTSSDNNVATVANGVIKAVGGGEATITVKTVNDKTATIAVSVYAPVTGVTVAEPSATRIAVGDTLTLTATVAPADASEKGIVWTSSDDKIATVSAAGVVTPVEAGEVTITATSKDNDKMTDSVTLTIYRKVTGVTLNENSLNMTAGDNDVTLVATVAPDNATDKSVTWTSSDEKVVTVADGTLTAVAAGDAVITVTTKDGGYTATCNVHAYAQVEDIAVSGDKTEIRISETLQLGATVTPANADQAVVWTSSDDKIATVSAEGLVTGVAEGDVTITATAADGTTKDTYTLSVVTFNNKTGELKLDASLTTGKVVVGNSANSLLTVTVEEDGTLYYTYTAVSGRNALMGASDVKTAEVKAGDNFIQLEIASNEVMFVNLLLVGEYEGQPTDDTLASDIVKAEWTAEDFATIDTEGIDTWEELKAALAVNADITLTANIDAQGEAYAPTLSNYSSTFDGQGFAILNLNIVATSAEAGLFKSIRTPAVIKNITFINASIDGGTYDQAGLIAGTNGETANNVITVSNIKVLGLTVKGSNSQYGGLFGRIKGADTDITISDCYIKATFNQTVIEADEELGITADDSIERVAGVIGYSDYNSKITVTGCTVDVTFNSLHGNRVAGIISHMTGGTGVLTINDNTVTATFNNCTSERVGGLVGSIEQSQAYLDGNTVSVYFVNTNGEANQGGILGNVTNSGKADITNTKLYVEYSGAINATRQGGMIGQVANSSGIIVNIDNCYVSVQFVDIASQSMDFFGIITGAAEVQATMNISYLYGETNLVSPYGGSVGAAIGAMQCEQVTMTNCIYVANDDFAGKEGNAGIYGANYSGGAEMLVATDVQVTTAAAGIDATIAANFANAEVNTEGSADWTYDAEANTLVFAIPQA